MRKCFFIIKNICIAVWKEPKKYNLQIVYLNFGFDCWIIFHSINQISHLNRMKKKKVNLPNSVPKVIILIVILNSDKLFNGKSIEYVLNFNILRIGSFSWKWCCVVKNTEKKILPTSNEYLIHLNKTCIYSTQLRLWLNIFFMGTYSHSGVNILFHF